MKDVTIPWNLIPLLVHSTRCNHEKLPYFVEPRLNPAFYLAVRPQNRPHVFDELLTFDLLTSDEVLPGRRIRQGRGRFCLNGFEFHVTFCHMQAESFGN